MLVLSALKEGQALESIVKKRGFMFKKWGLVAIVGILFVGLSGCTGTPDNVEPVEGFELPRYLGEWYEIARFDHSFEEGLTEVTATYSMRDDGGVKVINRGYSKEEGTWDEAEGKAYFVESETTGHLKVSFFGPFYASYVIIELDKKGYQYALITGPDKDYLWILARSPSISDEVRARLLEKAEVAGYDVSKLIWVEHGKVNS